MPRLLIRLLAVLVLLAADMLSIPILIPPAQAQVDDRYIGIYYSRRTQPVRRTTPDQGRRRTEAEATRPPQDRGDYAVPPSLHALVMGDSFAEWLAYGLDLAFEDVPELGILDRSQLTSGLMRPEPADWPALIRDNLAMEPKADFIVFTAGFHDREPLKLDNETIEITSPRWVELYEQRLTQTMDALKQAGKPVFWVGIPPIRGPRNGEVAQLNRIIRERAEEAGITFIDVWNAFSDDQGNFTQSGPDVVGQTRRLRTSDGVNFTNAGSRKYAFYVEQPLRQLLLGRIGGGGIAAPGEVPAFMPELGLPVPMPAPTVLPDIGASLIRQRPDAGPVIPLTGTAAAVSRPVGGLISAQTNQPKRGNLAPELSLGEPLNPPPGRADDFRWQGARLTR